MFVSLERQNKLQVYKKLDGGNLSATPLFTKESLENPKEGSGQVAGTLHVHPNGRFLYQANRASGTVEYQGQRVFAGGENAIAVYSIRQETGEPVLIQHADTRGFVPRTFALDASGRMLVAANQTALSVREGQSVKIVPAGLSTFRVRNDGRLDFVHKYDVETSASRSLFWMGLVSLP